MKSDLHAPQIAFLLLVGLLTASSGAEAACEPTHPAVARKCYALWDDRCSAYQPQFMSTISGTAISQKFLPLPQRSPSLERSDCWLHCLRTAGCTSVAYFRRGGVRKGLCFAQAGSGSKPDSKHELLTACSVPAPPLAPLPDAAVLLGIPPPAIKGAGVPGLPTGFWSELGISKRVVAEGNTVTMSVDPKNFGCRMESTWKARSALVCADIKLSTKVNNGTVFAMYAISQEPGPLERGSAKWWELDWEFLGRERNSAWISWYEAGVVNPRPHFHPLPQIPDITFQRFCLDWDVDAHQVIWTVDGQEFQRMTMDPTWNEPLQLVFSYWVGRQSNENWVGGTGVYERSIASVRDVRAVIRG